MFYKRNMSHIHLCICCVICLIFISKWDPFRNKSYQREAILKINRYYFFFFFFFLNVFRALPTGVGACTMLVIFGFDWNKQKKEKRKKRKSRDSNPRQSSCFRGIRLVQSATEACYFTVKKNRLVSVCLIYVTKHDQT